MKHVPAQPSSLPLEIHPDLTLEQWLCSPDLSFAIWMRRNDYAESTRTVKIAMWNKFLHWAEGKRLTLDSITYQNLHSFLEEAEIVKAHGYRYLRLIERVYVYLIDLGLPLKRNPASEARDKTDKEEKKTWINDPTVFLEREEKEKIEKVIMDRLRMYGGMEKKVEKEGKGRKKQSWVMVRDAAIAAVMVGGGATVGSISKLSVNCTKCAEGRISLPKEGGGDYEAVLLPIGDLALTAWRRLLRHRVGAGKLIFPADIKFRVTDVDTAGMHPSTVFRAVRSVFRDAGITGKRACGATLRNTYAAQLIDLGCDDLELQDCMGFKETMSALRLRNAYFGITPTENDPITAKLAKPG